MVCNCGMVLIPIRHVQNVIHSNQYPITLVLRGIGKVPPYTSCFLRTSRNPKKRLPYEKTYKSSILWRITIGRIFYYFKNPLKCKHYNGSQGGITAGN